MENIHNQRLHDLAVYYYWPISQGRLVLGWCLVAVLAPDIGIRSTNGWVSI